jgi:5'-nucleotidase
VIVNITGNITATPNDSGESVLGDLIADAQLYNNSNPSYGGAVVAFTNPEGILSNLKRVEINLQLISRMVRLSVSNPSKTT